MAKTEYDNLGRTVKTIDAYTDGTPTDSTNQTTEYAYDGVGYLLTMKALLPGSNADVGDVHVVGTATSRNNSNGSSMVRL